MERDLLVGKRPGEEMPAAGGSATGGRTSSARPASIGVLGRLRRTPLRTAFGVGGLALMALNAALLLLERCAVRR